MAGARSFLCSVMLALAAANYHSHSCPFLSKVVPEGQQYMERATNFMRLRATDCKAFAHQFTEQGDFEFLQHKMNSQAEVEKMCNERSPKNALVPVLLEDSLKTVFPSFSETRRALPFPGMLVQVQGSDQPSFLSHMQICHKTNTITHLKMLQETTSMPDTFRKVADKFVKQVYEKFDCSVYDDLVESDAIVQFNGEPKRYTKGLEIVFKGASVAKSACECKARKERMIHTENTISTAKYYYDASKKELTIMVERHVAVIFKPGVVNTRPMAVTLQFSDAGKIMGISTYETEVKHLEEKYATTYGLPAAQGHTHSWSLPVPDVKAMPAKEKPDPVAAMPAKEIPDLVATKKVAPSPTAEKTVSRPWVIETLSEISAATAASKMYWPCAMFAALSVGLSFA